MINELRELEQSKKDDKSWIQFQKDFDLPEKKSESWRKIDLKRINRIRNLPLVNENNLGKISQQEKIPLMDENSFRIIVKESLNQINLNSLPNGMSILNEREIEKHINKSLNQLNHENDWALKVNNASTKKISLFMINWSNKFVIIVLLIISAIALSKQAWA